MHAIVDHVLKAAGFSLDDIVSWGGKVVYDAGMAYGPNRIGAMQRGEINAIYDKWFTKPIPPKGVNLKLPMTAQFKKVVAKPTSSGDPKDYQ